MNLYWCSTSDHDEDWFIIAPRNRDARRIHAYEEGYNFEDTKAQFVCRIPQCSLSYERGWPSHELLVVCGAEIVRESQPRIVEIAGSTYEEGRLDAEIDRHQWIARFIEQGVYNAS
jgi:hypothetical protein